MQSPSSGAPPRSIGVPTASRISVCSRLANFIARCTFNSISLGRWRRQRRWKGRRGRGGGSDGGGSLRFKHSTAVDANAAPLVLLSVNLTTMLVFLLGRLCLNSTNSAQRSSTEAHLNLAHQSSAKAHFNSFQRSSVRKKARVGWLLRSLTYASTHTSS